jgi:two-component system CheB/CheR fusion protein
MSHNLGDVDQKKIGPPTPLRRQETKLVKKRNTTIHPAKSDPPLPTLRVLVVDDDADTVEAERQVLESLGQQVCAVRDGPQALQAAPAFRPQVIVLDIRMPGMDGYEVARQLRRLDECRKVLLVAVTGHDQPEERHEAYQAGFDQFLVKPFGREELAWLLGLAK